MPWQRKRYVEFIMFKVLCWIYYSFYYISCFCKVNIVDMLSDLLKIKVYRSISFVFANIKYCCRVFPDAQICAFWRMFSTNDPQNELTLRHTGRTQCLSKWINPQPYFIVFNNIYLCQLVKLLQNIFKYQFASVRLSIL